MAKILVAEDDNATGITVKLILEKENHTVELVRDGQDAHEKLADNDFELIVLDIRLPKMSGYEVCRGYRAKGGQSPVLMLTGLKTIEQKEEGFGSGADDYLTKPFDARELTMRANALLRRGNTYHDDIITVRGLELNSRLKLVTLNGELVDLRPKEHELLEYFMKRQDQYFTLKQLLEAVWPSDSDVMEDAVRKCLSRLRKKIETNSSFIVNTKNMGYRLVSQEPASESKT